MKRRRFAKMALLAALTYGSVVANVCGPAAYASELPPPLEACLGACPPARTKTAPPAELSDVERQPTVSCDFGRAASEVLARVASLAGLASDSLARWSERAPAAEPQDIADQEVDYGHLPLGYLSFVPCHDYSQGILHEYDPDVQAIFAPQRLERLLSDRRLEPLGLQVGALAAVPLPAKDKAAKLAADERHSTGQAEVLELNAKQEGLHASSEPVRKQISNKALAQPEVIKPRYWFEDYTFGYEYDNSCLALETYLAMQQVFATQVPVEATDAKITEEHPAEMDLPEVEYFETILAGPSRYVFLRTGSARLDAERAVAAETAALEAKQARVRRTVSEAARWINELGTALVYLSCDTHPLAER